jgi:hypothetical protein
LAVRPRATAGQAVIATARFAEGMSFWAFTLLLVG